MTGSRLLTSVLLAGLGCLLAVGIAWPQGDEPAAEPAGDPAGERAGAATAVGADRVEPLAVLSAWDRARADAWRRGDEAALARLYVAGSAAGRADRALLAAYAERGLRVTGLLVQRAAVEVIASTYGRIELVVTDRLVGATAVGPRGRVLLPRDGWSRHRIVLRSTEGGWRVAEAREVSAARTPAPT